MGSHHLEKRFENPDGAARDVEKVYWEMASRLRLFTLPLSCSCISSNIKFKTNWARKYATEIWQNNKLYTIKRHATWILYIQSHR